MKPLRIKIESVRPDLVAHLEKSVEAVAHVQAAHFDAANSDLVVEHNGADRQEIAAAIREEGFAVADPSAR